MLAELDRHPHARSVLGGALGADGRPSHAYLFHGPGGAGKRAAARAVAAELLVTGSPEPSHARLRALSGAHPDLTWVTPSGAHEILVSDIAGPVVAAASRTPFESSRRVFVIERVDELGEEAANRMLKTLEEPAPFVHLILLTERLMEVLPTIRSRCQLVRFESPSEEELTARLEQDGVPGATARACARLSLGDGQRAQELASAEGAQLRSAAKGIVDCALAGTSALTHPWSALLEASRTRGQRAREQLEARAAEELTFYPRKEHRRIENEWTERIRRVRRRVETGALDLGLQLVSLWLFDLLLAAHGAPSLVRNCDEAEGLHRRPGDPRRLRTAIELVEDTRLRFPLNVSEELACEALTYRLEDQLSG